jgi:hypothetical protein
VNKRSELSVARTALSSACFALERLTRLLCEDGDVAFSGSMARLVGHVHDVLRELDAAAEKILGIPRHAKDRKKTV